MDRRCPKNGKICPARTADEDVERNDDNHQDEAPGGPNLPILCRSKLPGCPHRRQLFYELPAGAALSLIPRQPELLHNRRQRLHNNLPHRPLRQHVRPLVLVRPARIETSRLPALSRRPRQGVLDRAAVEVEHVRPRRCPALSRRPCCRPSSLVAPSAHVFFIPAAGAGPVHACARAPPPRPRRLAAAHRLPRRLCASDLRPLADSDSESLTDSESLADSESRADSEASRPAASNRRAACPRAAPPPKRGRETESRRRTGRIRPEAESRAPTRICRCRPPSALPPDDSPARGGHAMVRCAMPWSGAPCHGPI